MLELKGDQPGAVDKVAEWLKKPRNQREQVFRLYGGAGVGKTTVAQVLAQDFNTHFMTLSGKAALVMRSKGAAGATTIHSAIYRPDDSRGDVQFVLNKESFIRELDLLVVDEVGMVGQTLGEDLMSFGVPILALGDPNQLQPPSGEAAYFTSRPADFMMNEILRQAKDSPIITMAYDALNGVLKPGKYGNCNVYSSKVKDHVVRESMLAADQVLCGKNATRVNNNVSFRNWLGLSGDAAGFLPTEGERLICLANNHKKGILNGEQFKLLSMLPCQMSNMLKFLAVSMDSGSDVPVEFTVPYEWFRGAESELDRYDRLNFEQATYAYCMTVHKAQGSQWKKVTILDESRSFKESRANHLYTALTRAAEQADVFL